MKVHEKISYINGSGLEEKDFYYPIEQCDLIVRLLFINNTGLDCVSLQWDDEFSIAYRFVEDDVDTTE